MKLEDLKEQISFCGLVWDLKRACVTDDGNALFFWSCPDAGLCAQSNGYTVYNLYAVQFEHGADLATLLPRLLNTKREPNNEN